MKDVTDQYEMDTEGVELVSVYDTHNKHLLFVEYRRPPGSSGDGKGVAFFHRRSLEEFTGPEAPRRKSQRYRLRKRQTLRSVCAELGIHIHIHRMHESRVASGRVPRIQFQFSTDHVEYELWGNDEAELIKAVRRIAGG